MDVIDAEGHTNPSCMSGVLCVSHVGLFVDFVWKFSSVSWVDRGSCCESVYPADDK